MSVARILGMSREAEGKAILLPRVSFTFNILSINILHFCFIFDACLANIHVVWEVWGVPSASGLLADYLFCPIWLAGLPFCGHFQQPLVTPGHVVACFYLQLLTAVSSMHLRSQIDDSCSLLTADHETRTVAGLDMCAFVGPCTRWSKRWKNEESSSKFLCATLS